MDPLADVLRLIRLDGAYFYKVEASDIWSVESPSADRLLPRILPAAEHLISYHFLTAGRCFGGLLGGEQVEMIAGDALLFPHGDAYVMSSARGLKSTIGAYHTPDRFPHVVELGTGLPRNAEFVCGFLGCDRRPFNPLLASLPRQMHLKAMSPGWHSNFTARVVEESREGRAGSASVLSRLAEVMFIEVLRRHAAELPAGGTGWLAALGDEIVGRTLSLVHARPGHPWTISELAKESASSRSKLSERFMLLVGQPPMQYLTQWRIQVAANLLAQSDTKVSVVAGEVGYTSEAAFNRAFRRITGQTPGAWRTSRRTAVHIGDA
jgi:AraC-like DNA-binding protein